MWKTEDSRGKAKFNTPVRVFGGRMKSDLKKTFGGKGEKRNGKHSANASE